MAKRARRPASRVSNALQRTERQRLLLDGIRLAQSQFIAGNNKAQFFRALLDTIVAATGSAYGFIGEIVQPPAGAPYLQSVVTSRFPRTKKTRQLWKEREKRGSQFRNLDTLFGHVIATAKPVIANDAGHDPRAGGLPPGHPPLKAFLGLPFHHGDALVGMVGLANRKGGYDKAVIRELEPFLMTCGMLMQESRLAATRAEAQADLRKLAMLAARTVNGVVLTDAAGCVQWVNEGFTRITGYAPDDVMGRKPGQVLQGPDTDPATVEYMRAQIAKGESFHVEIVNYAKGGRPYWVALDVQPMCDESGRVVNFMGVQSDITARKRAEAEVAAERDFAVQVMNAMATGVTVTDERGRFEFVNPAYAEMLGYEPADLIGRTQWDVTYPEDHEIVRDGRARRMRGEHFLYETRLCHRDGRLVPVVVAGGARTRGGAIVGTIGSVMDLTERKRFEESLHEARRQAEAATAAKSAFVANMSHEIRTPMNAVIGMTSVLLTTPLSHEQRELVETIRRSGETLLGLTNDILDFSKIETGRLELERSRFVLQDCLDGATGLVSHWASGKGLAVSIAIDPGVPPAVVGDATRLRQVLVNLLTNAVKFTEHGEVAVSVTSRALEAGGYELEFAVRDTGIGIPANRMDRLFQTFSQVDASTTRHYGGSGLGLAICRRLCELMGGRIWVESEEKRGSTFRFTVHVQAAIDPGDERAKAQEIGPDLATRLPLRVLLVEDNLINQRVAQLLLSRMGYRADVAANGREAVEALSRQQYDVVLMDVQMPEMDGLDATRAIRRGGQPTMPWIIGMTADATVEGRDACMAAGMNDYVTKPVEPYRLRDALERAAREVGGPTQV